MSNGDALEVLTQLLRDWPTSLDEHESEVRKRLEGRISESLPSESLRTIATGEWQLACPLLIHSGIGKCLVIDTKDDTLPVLTELTLQAEKWILTSFYQQCPVCFGLGINDRKICDLCFGVGWGCH
jgi:hypothetical protein